jgi:hypothetical protein
METTGRTVVLHQTWKHQRGPLSYIRHGNNREDRCLTSDMETPERTVVLHQTWKHQRGPLSRRIVTDHWFGCKRQAQGISTSTQV